MDCGREGQAGHLRFIKNRGRTFLSQWCCLRPKLATLHKAELLGKRDSFLLLQLPRLRLKQAEAESFSRPCFPPARKGPGQKQAFPWSPHTSLRRIRIPREPVARGSGQGLHLRSLSLGMATQLRVPEVLTTPPQFQL